MRAFTTLIIVFLLCNIDLKAQNVGIGTADPQAKLHVKTTIGLVQAKSENFNNGEIDPKQQKGTVDWTTNNEILFEGAYGGSLPASMKAGDQAVLVVPYNNPTDKTILITFFYRNDVSDELLTFEVTYPGGNKMLNQKTGNWQQENRNYISVLSSGELRFIVTAIVDIANPAVFLDNITVSFMSDPALKIDDGSQHNGAFLRSDQFGNASWYDLSGEIDQQVAGATQNLFFRTTNNRLEIDNGNAVRIKALSNDEFKSLELNENTLELTSGSSFTIGKAPNTKFFHYDGEEGHMSWGADNVGHNPTGTHTTRWGFENKPHGNFSTAWGRKNYTASLYSTIFGNSNGIQNGDYATVWGFDNDVQGNYSTVWGEGNTSKTTSSNSTIWGDGNSVLENSHNNSVWGINNTVAGNFGTVWGAENFVATDSFATVWGVSNRVTGKNATSWGKDNQVSGPVGTSWGVNNNVVARNGTAWGDDNYVSGVNATAIGFDSRATGDHSMAIGQNARAQTYGELAIGRYNSSSGSETEWEASDNAFSIGNGNASLFGARNSFVVKKDGKTGINNSSPEYALDIALNGYSEGIRLGNYDYSIGNGAHLVLEGRNQAIRFQKQGQFGFSLNYNSEDNLFAILDGYDHIMTVDNGKIGLGNFAPARLLDLGADSAMKPGTSTWEVPSDRRLKNNIKPFKQGLESIQKINPVWFTYNGTGGIPRSTTVGTVAQELEEVAPFMVSEWNHVDENKRETAYKSVNYHSLNFMLVNAVKELDQQNKELRSEVEELKVMVKDLLDSKKASKK